MFIGPGVKINPGVGVTALPPDPVYIMRILDSEDGSVITTCNEGDEIWIEAEWAYLTVPSGEGSYLLLGGASITAQDVYAPGPIESTDPIPWGSDQNIPGFSPLGGTTGSPALVNADRLTEGNETLTWSWYVNGQIVASASVTIVDTSINPTYTLSTVDDVTSIDEGEELIFNVTTTDVDDGTTLYWGIGIGGTNMSFGRLSSSAGSVTVSGGAASFSITVSADELSSPDQQEFIVRLYKDGPGDSGGIQVDDITIDVNDTSLTRPQWTNGDATASGLSVSYRYYKFNITKVRNIISATNNTQISELIILNGSTRLTGGTATNPNGTQVSAGEAPSKILDGYYDTKWCDLSFVSNSNTSTLIIDYTTAQTSNGFTFATANDYEGRDPVRWTFEGSNDGSTWTVIHEQFADATITTSRNTLVSTVFSYPTHGSAVFNQPQTDYVSLPALPDWNLGTTWTVEFWLYMNSSSVGTVNQQGGIWALLNQKGWATKDSINIALSGGYLQINQGNDTSYYNKYIIEPTPLQWVHVAIVNNAGTNKVYYNGIEQIPPGGIGSVDYTASWTNSTNPLYIGSLGDYAGGAGSGGSTFDGKLTNLRITDRAEYLTNFNPPTVLPTKITNHTRLLWTPTDQALATDTSDDPHTITNTGVTYSSSYPATNNTRGSAVFDASTNRFYKVPGSGSQFALGTTYTIEWWQKTVTATTGGQLYTVMSQAPDSGRIDIYYQDGVLKVQNGTTLCAEPPVGVWTHVALVNNAGTSAVYYDGVAQTLSGSLGTLGQTQDLYIGKRGNNNFQYFNGKLTNIRILDTAYYGPDFVPEQLPAVIAGHTQLLLRPTVDTIYGVDEGNSSLSIGSNGVRYSSDYAPVTNTYTARTYNENDQYAGGYSGNAIKVYIPDYPDILNVANGATIVLTGQTSGTFTVGSGLAFSQATTSGTVRNLALGLGISVYGGDNLTFAWRT